MQAYPNTDRTSAKQTADPSGAPSKLPEYAYRAATLAVMVLLLWTVA
jgi:hypothetical protein